MLRALVVASVLVTGAAAQAGDPEIRGAGGTVTIHAANMPLAQILDRLATATGMTVTYEGTRPSMPVTMTADGISEVHAILRLMEGLGVSYVMRTDATGQRVDTLIISGTGGGGSVVAAAQQGPPPEPAYEEPVGDYGHIPLDPAVLEAAGPQTKPDLNNPYLGLPPQHFPQAAQQQQQPEGDPTGSSGSRDMPGAPMFPQGASYPR